MKITNILLAALILSSSVSAAVGTWTGKKWDTKADRVALRKPYGSHPSNVKFDGFIIIGDFNAPLDWHSRIIRHLKILKKNAPDIYKLGQKHAPNIQYNGHAHSSAAPWRRRIGIGLHDFNFGYGNLTATLIHEFMHCHPKDGSHGPVYYAEYRYGKRCGVHPWILVQVKGHGTALGWNEARWLKTFPNMK
tara:strand:- start:3695 stop:4267 length:573 start_codon:yes stop_codon:yes gene_type:complete